MRHALHIYFYSYSFRYAHGLESLSDSATDALRMRLCLCECGSNSFQGLSHSHKIRPHYKVVWITLAQYYTLFATIFFPSPPETPSVCSVYGSGGDGWVNLGSFDSRMYLSIAYLCRALSLSLSILHCLYCI